MGARRIRPINRIMPEIKSRISARREGLEVSASLTARWARLYSDVSMSAELCLGRKVLIVLYTLVRIAERALRLVCPYPCLPRLARDKVSILQALVVARFHYMPSPFSLCLLCDLKLG